MVLRVRKLVRGLFQAKETPIVPREKGNIVTA
jgi:hypothetical protein